MNNTIKFTTTFDENIIREQSNIYLKHVWKAQSQREKYILFFSIISFILFLSQYLYERALSLMFLAVAGHYYYLYYINKQSYKNNKKHYKNSISHFKRIIENKDQSQHWEFTNEYISYSDARSNIKLIWEALHSYLILEDNLFLIVDNNYSFFINKNQVGEERFDKLVTLTQSKSHLFLSNIKA